MTSGSPGGSATAVRETDAPRGTADVVRAIAHAKLNLYLHVTGRRADGYHLLDSLFAFAEFGDEIAVRPAAAPDLTVSGPFAADLVGTPPDENLCLKAASRFAALSGCSGNVSVHLTKNLPVASGVGGGSADAAATIRALSVLWDVPLPDARELTVLGADVPACLDSQACLVSGIGDRVAPLPAIEPRPILLVNAGVPVATGAVFRGLNWPLPDHPPAPRPEALGVPGALMPVLRNRRNDLADSAVALAPVVGEVIGLLRDVAPQALVRLSGSGGTVFALFGKEEEEAAAAAALRRRRPAWWIAETRLCCAPLLQPDGSGAASGPSFSSIPGSGAG